MEPQGDLGFPAWIPSSVSVIRISKGRSRAAVFFKFSPGDWETQGGLGPSHWTLSLPGQSFHEPRHPQHHGPSVLDPVTQEDLAAAREMNVGITKEEAGILVHKRRYVREVTVLCFLPQAPILGADRENMPSYLVSASLGMCPGLRARGGRKETWSSVIH